MDPIGANSGSTAISSGAVGVFGACGPTVGRGSVVPRRSEGS